jgi:hypothetical protein
MMWRCVTPDVLVCAPREGYRSLADRGFLSPGSIANRQKNRRVSPNHSHFGVSEQADNLGVGQILARTDLGVPPTARRRSVPTTVGGTTSVRRGFAIRALPVLLSQVISGTPGVRFSL